MRDTAAYMARRDLFTSGLEMERSEQISRKETMRESAERISLNKRVSGAMLAALRSYRKSQSFMTMWITIIFASLNINDCCLLISDTAMSVSSLDLSVCSQTAVS